MATLYKTGSVCTATSINGKISFTDFVCRQYKVTAQYRVEDRDFSINAEFFSFFTGPGMDDRAKVYYSPEHPENAVLSWAYDARHQAWLFMIFLFALSLLLSAAALITMGNGFSEIAKVRRLALKGRIESALVTGLSTQRTNYMSTPTRRKKVSITLNLRLKYGECVSASYELGKDTPWFIEGEHEVAVLTCNEEWHMLRHDGYPLLLQL